MPKTSKRVYFSIGAIAAFALLASFGLPRTATWQTHAQSGLIGLSTEALPQPNLPVKISDAQISPDIVTRSMSLRYALLNRGDATLARIRLVVIAYDEAGNPEVGEHITDRVALGAGEHEEREVSLSNFFYFGPIAPFSKFVIAVDSGGTSRGSWNLGSPDELFHAMRLGTQLDLSPQSVEDVGTTCGSECVSDAREICGSQGVHMVSFKGVPPNCDCSFACNAPKPNQP